MQLLHLETPTSENLKNKIKNHNEHHNNQEKPKDPFIIQNKLIFKKYHPIKQIGKGTFSTVYLASIVNTNKYVAIKAEKKSPNSVELLKSEACLLYSLRGFGIPEVISYGRTKYHNILVMPLLGESLLDMFILRSNPINLNDICVSSLQILDRIEWVHVNNIVYRDIKPENFLFGKSDSSVLYLIDFGLCRKYRSIKTGKHIAPKNLGKFTGTSRYASVYAMAGNEQSRRDDIESIGYMIIYFMKKKLPWQGIRGNSYKECYHKLYLMKKHMELEILCRGLPKEVLEYMKYAKSLKFEQEPNYKYLKNLFHMILNKNQVNIDSYILSWCRKDNTHTLKKDHSAISINNPINNNQNNNNKTQKMQRKISPPNKLYKKIKESLDDKNKSHNFSTNNLQNLNLNSTLNKNELNSEVSNTMKVLVSKNLQSVNNSNQNQSAGLNINLVRINSEKNVYSDNFFIQGMNNHLRGYAPQNYKVSQLMSYNQQLSDRNNFNSGEKYNYYANYINNNMSNTKTTKKIVSISPIQHMNINKNNKSIIFNNINNSKNRYNKITQIKIAEVNKDNNNINNINKNASKENIIYNTYNTYNTYNSYNNINNISTPINNNNSYFNSIYRREPAQIINYQNYNRIKKNNIQNNTLLNYIKSESFIEENKNNNKVAYPKNNQHINNISKNNYSNYSSIEMNNKNDSITEHFQYKNYQNQNKKQLNSYNSVNNIKKSNTALNKNKIISITPTINSTNTLNKNSSMNNIQHYNSYIIKDVNSNNHSNINKYSNSNNTNNNINNHGKNNFLKITKHSNNKNVQNMNNKKSTINENRSMNITKSYTNRISTNFPNIKDTKSNQHNKTLDNNSYYLNNNRYPITKNQTSTSYINKSRQNSNSNKNQKSSTQVLNSDNRNKINNKLIFSKMEPSLPNHSLKIVKASSKTKIKENISNENSLKNGNKNRINKYKILRNRNAQNH